MSAMNRVAFALALINVGLFLMNSRENLRRNEWRQAIANLVGALFFAGVAALQVP